MAAPQETFTQGTSFLHGLDPRTKVFATACLSLVLAIIQHWQFAGLGLLLGLSLLVLARLPWRSLVKRLLLVNTFTLFLWIMLPLTYGGDDFSLGPLGLSLRGCALAGLITLKTNAIVSVMLALLATSTVPAVGQAMRWWKVPEKLCLILVFSYRYLFVIHEEYTRLRRAAAMRCFVPGTNMTTYRTFGNLVGMTLVRSHNRAQRVGQAMALRCFSGTFHSLGIAPASVRDLTFGAASLAVAVLLLIGGA